MAADSNSPVGGGVLASSAEEMAAYDALPRPVQEALGSGIDAWSAVNVLARWEAAAARYGVDRATAAAVRAIREADRALIGSGRI